MQSVSKHLHVGGHPWSSRVKRICGCPWSPLVKCICGIGGHWWTLVDNLPLIFPRPQSFPRPHAFSLVLSCFSLLLVLSLSAAESPLTDGEVWNEGVTYYNAGDVTNAIRVLRPLMLSKTHGARAAEVVAKLELERGNQEEAASAAQIALRAHPDDPRANRNFTRATDKLLESRETKHINDVLKAAQGQDPGAALQSATREARQLMTEAGSYRTNAAARAIAISDRLSKRAETLADVWIPVREVIAQSVTNEEQAATIVAQIEQAQAKTKKAAKEISDLNAEGYATMAEVENDFTRFLKLVILPPAAIDEDILAQTNAWQDVETVNNRAWQQEALDYTRAFRAKFPAWARAYEQQAQSDPNTPPFTAETQAKISGLATELEKLQLECCEKCVPPSQEKALEILRQIQELLPKDKNNNQQQQNQQNQQNQQPNQDQQQNKDQKDQKNDQNQDQQQDQKQDQDPSQQPQDDKKDEEKEPEPEEDKEDQEIEATLKKAQERNDEHEAEKKARMRKAPLPPNERDW